MGMSDFTVKEANALLLGRKGRLTITDTNVHYGNYCALTFLSDTIFAASGLVDELNQLANGIVFTGGGTTEIVAGNFLSGATSGALVQVKDITLTGGTWADGNAAGWMIAEPVNGTGTSALENMDLVTVTNPTGSAAVAASVTADVLTTGTEAAGGVTTGDTQIGGVYLSGTTIFGSFTKIQLASGSVEAYKG